MLKRVFISLFALAVIAALAPLSVMALHGIAARPAKADAILVPGAALKNGGNDLSDALQYRMDTAIELWKLGYAPKLLLSGGGEANWNEAEGMARYATRNGVPESALILDRRGDTTRESANNAARLLGHGARVLAVSQWYHVPRLRIACRQAGLDASGSACAHPRFLAREAEFVLREVAGLWAYGLRMEESALVNSVRSGATDTAATASR